MKCSTAIGHLEETGEVSSEQLRFRGTDIGWPVEELWVTGDLLRLRKRALQWCYRPLGWPVWDHRHRWLARYWSAGAGLDGTVIDALRTRRLDRLEVVEPTASELARQLQVELPVSRGHLRTMIGRYWERDWRREHKG